MFVSRHFVCNNKIRCRNQRFRFIFYSAHIVSKHIKNRYWWADQKQSTARYLGIINDLLIKHVYSWTKKRTYNILEQYRTCQKSEIKLLKHISHKLCFKNTLGLVSPIYSIFHALWIFHSCNIVKLVTTVKSVNDPVATI